MALTIVETPHRHRRCGHPRRCSRSSRVGPHRRPVGHGELPDHPGWIRPAVGLAARSSGPCAGRGGRHRQLRRRPDPASGGRRCRRWSRWTARTARTATGSGKSDPLDAKSAARAALSGEAKGAPRGRDGTVEAIRALMVAKRSARGERTRSINQARALVVTGPDDLRARFEPPPADCLDGRPSRPSSPSRRDSRLRHPRGGGGYRHGMSWGASVVCDHVRSVFLRLCVAGGMDGMVKPGGGYR